MFLKRAFVDVHSDIENMSVAPMSGRESLPRQDTDFRKPNSRRNAYAFYSAGLTSGDPPGELMKFLKNVRAEKLSLLPCGRD